MSAKKPSMRDIARAVGTSAVTVSKAMAGKPGMSDRLRAKILKETPVPPAGDNPDNKDEKDKRMEDIMRKSMGLPPRK